MPTRYVWGRKGKNAKRARTGAAWTVAAAHVLPHSSGVVTLVHQVRACSSVNAVPLLGVRCEQLEMKSCVQEMFAMVEGLTSYLVPSPKYVAPVVLTQK